LQVISIICALLMVLSAIGTVIVLRNANVEADSSSDDDPDGGDTEIDPALQPAACAAGRVD